MSNTQRLEKLIARSNTIEMQISPGFQESKCLEKRPAKEIVFKTSDGQKMKASKELLAQLTGKYSEVIAQKRQATTFDWETYLNPVRMFNLIRLQKFAELRADDREQYQSFIQRPWWGLQKYLITEFLYPTTTVAQNYSDAMRKFENNKNAKITGLPVERLSNDEKAFDEWMNLLYTPLATQAKLLENGEYLVSEINYFFVPALKIGFEITRADMRDGSMALTNGKRMKEGELAKDVIGRHGNTITNIFQGALSFLPIPFFKIGKRGGGH
jgi:hypothetical protein